MMVECIEFYKTANTYYVLGSVRDSCSLVMRRGFAANFKNYEIKSVTAVSDDEHEIYYWYKYISDGIYRKTYECLPEAIGLESLKVIKIAYVELYLKYNK